MRFALLLAALLAVAAPFVMLFTARLAVAVSIATKFSTLMVACCASCSRIYNTSGDCCASCFTALKFCLGPPSSPQHQRQGCDGQRDPNARAALRGSPQRSPKAQRKPTTPTHQGDRDGARKMPADHLPCALALVLVAQPSARLPRAFRAPCAKKRRKNGPLGGAVQPSGVTALRPW